MLTHLRILGYYMCLYFQALSKKYFRMHSCYKVSLQHIVQWHVRNISPSGNSMNICYAKYIIWSHSRYILNNIFLCVAPATRFCKYAMGCWALEKEIKSEYYYSDKKPKNKVTIWQQVVHILQQHSTKNKVKIFSLRFFRF